MVEKVEVDDGAFVWSQIRAEAHRDADSEPVLASYYYSMILSHSSLEQSLSFHLGNKLSSSTLLSTQLYDLFLNSFSNDSDLKSAMVADLGAAKYRDPACKSFCHCLLNYKGFLACQKQRNADQSVQEMSRADEISSGKDSHDKETSDSNVISVEDSVEHRDMVTQVPETNEHAAKHVDLNDSAAETGEKSTPNDVGIKSYILDEDFADMWKTGHFFTPLTLSTEVWRVTSEIRDATHVQDEFECTDNSPECHSSMKRKSVPTPDDEAYNPSKRIKELMKDNEIMKIRNTHLEGQLRMLQEDYDIKENDCEELCTLLEIVNFHI